MGMVYFIDGRSIPLSPRDTKALMMRLKEGGVRMMLTRDTEPQQAIIISNCPVAWVDLDEEQQPSTVVVREETANVKTEDAKAESNVDREKRILADIVAKSNCKHEPAKITYMKTEGKKGIRYFPLCNFCGWRGKFIAADELAEEVKASAQLYQEE